MVLLWPWALVGFGAVGLAALWALLRPSRRMAIVGSVALWREAERAMSDEARKRAKRVTQAWLLLLAGSVACVAALTRPSINASSRARRVALVLLPSAELGADRGIKGMQDAARRLLDRLDTRDRVRLLVPIETGIAFRGDLTVDQARQALGSLEPLPIPAADLKPVDVGEDVQHVYTFAAAGTSAAAGPKAGLIEVPHGLPAVTIDAVGAETTSDGKVQVFLALRNQTDTSWTGTLRCRGLTLPEKPDAPPRIAWQWTAEQYREVVMRGRREDIVLTVRPSDALAIDAVGSAVEAATRGAPPDASAYLIRRPARRTKVALVGRLDENLWRFVRSDPTLAPADADDPDVKLVIANHADPPADTAAIVIAPPTPPLRCRVGKEVKAVTLADANVTADHPVMRHVDLGGASLARVRPWRFGDSPLQEVLLWYKGQAVVIKQRTAPATGRPPRLYLAFDVSRENTALGMTKEWVIFLANAVRDLVPGATGQATFDYISPIEAGPAGGRVALAPQPEPAGAEDPSRYPWPGVYRYDDGSVCAVNSVGLRPGKPAVAVAAAIRGLDLPEPARQTLGVELWPALLAAAALFWLAGWRARLR